MVDECVLPVCTLCVGCFNVCDSDVSGAGLNHHNDECYITEVSCFVTLSPVLKTLESRGGLGSLL